MDPLLNESLKYIVQSKNLIKDFLEIEQIDNEALLILAVELLEKSAELLTRNS